MSIDDQLINEENDLVNLTDDEFLAKHGKPKPKPKPDDDTPILNAINALTAVANQILQIVKGASPPSPSPSPPPPPVTPALTASDMSVSMLQDKPIDIKLGAVDTIPGAVVSFTIITNPTNGVITTTDSITYTYTPTKGFVGTDDLVYTAADDKGQKSGSAVVKISVISVAPPSPPTPPPAPPGTNVDKFGIPKIYGDAPHPVNNWEFTGDLNDPRFMEQKFTDAGNGWLHFSNPTEGRVEIVSDPAANEKTIPTFDVDKVLAKGYLYKPVNSADGKGDFGNIEATWRYKVIKPGTGTTNGECHIEMVPGGYRQTSGTSDHVGTDGAVSSSCEAMSYHGNCYPLTGRTKFEKDSEHTTGYTKSDPEKNGAVAKFDNGQEVIQKMILYTLPNSNSSVVGGKSVKVETYFDETGTGNNLKKILEKLDDGTWGPTRGGNSACHCGENVVLSMARVAIGFRCDNMVEFQCKDMSVRSIDPTVVLHAEQPSKAEPEGYVEEDIQRTGDEEPKASKVYDYSKVEV